jgi:hypothetical protein
VNPQRGSRPYQYFRDTTNFKSRFLDNYFMSCNLNDFNDQLEQITENLKIKNAEFQDVF